VNELDRERAHVAELYARLDVMRIDEASRLAAVRAQGVGGNHQMRSERDAFARLHEDRLLQLRDVDDRLVFGRLRLAPDAARAGHETADATEVATDADADGIRYIGRLGLRDENQRSLLLDWRAPQASAFYQATAATPLGVLARRHLIMREREVLRLEDEVFDADLLAKTAGDEVQGEGALLAALSLERTGRMHDIVATIQAEQDRIIRSEMRGALVVQGGPGTGKTAVALHRAAYLLYTHRDRLGRAGVLIVGPSDAFMSYIESVLPSLGETGVVMQSLGELFPGVTATTDDAPDVAALKGSAEMVGLIARAVKSRQRVPAGPATIAVNGDRLTVQPTVLAQAIARAQASGKPHNEARVVFVTQALDRLTEQFVRQLRQAGRAIDDSDIALLREDLRASYDMRVLLNTAWMPLSAEKLIQDLYARPQWLAEITHRWPARQRALLKRPREAPFTISDVPLLDEAAEVLGAMAVQSDAGRHERDAQRRRDVENARQAIRNAGVEGMVSAEQLADNFADAGADGSTTADRARSDRTWTFGHVVVDEAQELSAMDWHVLLRRCPSRSITAVGDLAQRSAPAGAQAWADVLAPHLGSRWTYRTLTVNYRTPAEIMALAAAVLAEFAPDLQPPESVRATGEDPWQRTVPATDLAAEVRKAVEAEVAQLGRGTRAVIAADVDGLAGLPAQLHTPVSAKGLEFDAVVIVDPERIRAHNPADLYVSMTRATQRLGLLHVER
jgi:DNA helicase IV